MKTSVIIVCVLFFIACEQPYQDSSQRPEEAFELLDNASGERSYFNEYQGFIVAPNQEFDHDRLEQLAVASVDAAELGVSAALETFQSTAVANALIRAAERGVDVRIVADTDRLDQLGFNLLQDAQIPIVDGDGEIIWQALFGEDPVVRASEDNRMVHNFIVFDHLRVLWTTNGFEGDIPSPFQFGFAMNSEDLARDFEDSFDQLYGGVFSTETTFFQDNLSSDSNRRSHYPTLDGTLELYFGPQEPVVKEVIDSVYAARSDIWIATPALRNLDLLNALRYKHEAGFDVRILTQEPLSRGFNGLDASVRTAINQTLIIIDGDFSTHLSGYARGRAFVSSIPLIESVPFVKTDNGPKPQLSDQFIDGSLLALHQVDPSVEDHFIRLKDFFREALR